MAGVLGLSTACIDTRGDYNSFNDRVVDAAVNIEPDAPVVDEIPDITGEFLLAIDPVVAPGAYLQFIAETELDGRSLDMTLRALDRDTREVVPNADEVVLTDIEVTDTGEYFVEIMSPVPGRANPISGSDIVVDVDMSGIIRTMDLFCGAIDGMETTLNINLDGSTFGAVRIVPGTRGDDLPDPVGECPEIPPDAGVPDAMPPDAGMPDAMPADAAPDGDAMMNGDAMIDGDAMGTTG